MLAVQFSAFKCTHRSVTSIFLMPKYFKGTPRVCIELPMAEIWMEMFKRHDLLVALSWVLHHHFCVKKDCLSKLSKEIKWLHQENWSMWGRCGVKTATAHCRKTSQSWNRPGKHFTSRLYFLMESFLPETLPSWFEGEKEGFSFEGAFVAKIDLVLSLKSLQLTSVSLQN